MADAADDLWRADAYGRDARFVSDLGAEVLAWLDPRPGERVLDLGCGDGALTHRIAEAGAAVVGLDASPAMAAAAQARGVAAVTGDAADPPADRRLDGPFDAVFSNAALHWVTRPDAALAAVAARLRPGGRFAAEFGGHGNVAALRVALTAALRIEAGVDADLSTIWFFPTAEDYAARIAAAGLTVERIALIPRPTALPGDATAWIETLAAPVLALAPAARRPAVAACAQALAAQALRDAEGRWTADYMRLRVLARRPA